MFSNLFVYLLNKTNIILVEVIFSIQVKLMQFLLLLLLPISVYGLLGSKKNVTAMGHLECGGRPYQGVTVQLWDDDTRMIFF